MIKKRIFPMSRNIPRNFFLKIHLVSIWKTAPTDSFRLCRNYRSNKSEIWNSSQTKSRRIFPMTIHLVGEICKKTNHGPANSLWFETKKDESVRRSSRVTLCFYDLTKGMKTDQETDWKGKLRHEENAAGRRSRNLYRPGCVFNDRFDG